jgi:UDP-3-O-[3-hydroxymyristoyl] glucosamine N-acyltransferase
MAVIEVADPLSAFLTVFQHLHVTKIEPPVGIDPRAVVHPMARLGPDVAIGAFAVVGENTVLGSRCRLHPGVVIGAHCTVGDDVIIYPNAVVYDGCRLGSRVIVHANAVIGADGFGYRQHQGRHVKVPQLAGVEIGDDVEIGAATCIDRGTFTPTRIGSGTKIDNLVQIAHNCTIGEHNLFAAQTGLAGSCSTGEYVVFAGQAGVADHVHLGAGTLVGAKAGVIEDAPPGSRLHGIPARKARDVIAQVLCIERLPEMRKDVEKLKKAVGIE